MDYSKYSKEDLIKCIEYMAQQIIFYSDRAYDGKFKYEYDTIKKFLNK